MSDVAAGTRRAPALESATRVAVVAALSATSMLFAAVASAYLVRRSFVDWVQPSSAAWPFLLLAFGFAASFGIEVASRGGGRSRDQGLWISGIASALYLAAAVGVIVKTASGAAGLRMPHNAFLTLLLSLHVVHAIMGVAFTRWILGVAPSAPSENTLFLVRLVTHVLTAILFGIVLLLFVRS